jgi:hypothetical protein
MLAELAGRVASTERATVADNGDVDTFTFHARHERGDSHDPAVAEPLHEAPTDAAAVSAVEGNAFAVKPPSAPQPEPAAARDMQLPSGVSNVLALAIRHASSGAWKLERASRDAERLLLRIRSGLETDITVEVRAAKGAGPAFRVVDGVAFSYVDHGSTMSELDLRHLDTVAHQLPKVIAAVLRRTKTSAAKAVPIGTH